MLRGKTERCKGDRRKGFTLIELMIVIAIIAILAAVAATQYNSYKRKAKAKDLIGLARICAQELLEQCQYTDNVTISYVLASCSPENGTHTNMSVGKYLTDVDLGYSTTIPSGDNKANSASTDTYQCSDTNVYFAAAGKVDGVQYGAYCEVNKYALACYGPMGADLAD